MPLWSNQDFSSGTNNGSDMKGKSPQLHTGAVHKQKWHRRTKMESRKFVSLLSDFHLTPICNDKEGTEN